MSDRKTRADAFEGGLSDVQFMELRDGLLGTWTYEQAQTWLAVECGVDVSTSALYRFYHSHCAPVLSERRKLAALKSEQIARDAADNPVDWDAAAMERLKQLTFEFLLMPPDQVDSKAAARFLRELRGIKALNLDSRKFEELLDDKRKAEEAKKQLADATKRARETGGLSAETIEEIERAANLL